MSQDTLPYTQPQCQSSSENCWLPSELAEGSPSTLSANASLPSLDGDFPDFGLYLDESPIDDPSSLPCEPNCPGPHDFDDILKTLPLVSEIRFTTEEQRVIDSVLCSQIDFPTPFFPTENGHENPQQPPKKSRQSAASDHRLHHIADSDRQSKKRKLNRDAAYRYRQKVKAHNETLLNELRESVEAYEATRKEYETARSAFDALKTALSKPLSNSFLSCPRPVFY
ncbi:hypothetical protein Aperf_G00000005292 [Anoplocephala perfoliata]